LALRPTLVRKVAMVFENRVPASSRPDFVGALQGGEHDLDTGQQVKQPGIERLGHGEPLAEVIAGRARSRSLGVAVSDAGSVIAITLGRAVGWRRR